MLAVERALSATQAGRNKRGATPAKYPLRAASLGLPPVTSALAKRGGVTLCGEPGNGALRVLSLHLLGEGGVVGARGPGEGRPA